MRRRGRKGLDDERTMVHWGGGKRRANELQILEINKGSPSPTLNGCVGRVGDVRRVFMIKA